MACHSFDANSATFNWKSQITFSSLTSEKYISLSGLICQFRLGFFSTENKGSIYLLTVWWIHDNYDAFLHFTSNRSANIKLCGDVLVTIGAKQKIMAQSFFTSKHSQNHSYLLFTKPSTTETFLFSHSARIRWKKEKLSHREATVLCKKYNGHLPSFTSRSEQEEVIALVKLREEGKAVEGVFISLGLNNKVSTCFCSWHAVLAKHSRFLLKYCDLICTVIVAGCLTHGKEGISNRDNLLKQNYATPRGVLFSELM